ncbi:RICE SALT SENSITIVE 3-like [Olea europaea subsp. europaea]|nr:RICE SALT SENSITIVE 3-like [Olea europaea subsp. europaea]
MVPPTDFYNHFNQPMKITPSMSSLEALLSKLPSVIPVSSPPVSGYYEPQPQHLALTRPIELMGVDKVAKEELGEEEGNEKDVGETSNSAPPYRHHVHFAYNHDLNLSSSLHNNGC